MSEPAGATYEDALELQRQRRWAEAAAALQALAGRRLTANVAANLGICLHELGDVAAAERWLTLAARHMPEEAMVRERLARVLADAGKVEAAETAFRAALALEPDRATAEFGLGRLLLSAGRWPEGWPLLEARRRAQPGVFAPAFMPFPEWRGEDLAGKTIVVMPEQGFGDQIMLVRFAEQLKARGAARVVWGCRPELSALFATAPGVDLAPPVVPGVPATLPRGDYWACAFSVPGLLGATLASLPPAPYLRAPAGRLARAPAGARIGLAWRPNPIGWNVEGRGLPEPLAERLLARGAISLLPEDTGAADFADTAALLEGLDLVIAVDSAVAHLAGALGKPCWTLMPRWRVDWRWLRDRPDSPWYAATRIYRQDARGWEGLIERVVEDLDGRT